MPSHLYCQHCIEFVYPGVPHTCNPAFLVWCEADGETEDDAVRVHASGAQRAVEKWAEQDDCESADYRIVRGADLVATVKASGGEVTRWRVSGEAIPTYNAKREEG